MRDLLTPSIPAPLAAAAAGTTLPNIRVWLQRELLETPIELMPEPRAGKARMFPLLAVYEAAMLAGAAGGEVRTLSLINGAWHLRVLRMAADLAAAGKSWSDADFAAALHAAPDFAKRPTDNPFLWLVNLTPTPEGLRVAGLEMGSLAELQPKMAALSDERGMRMALLLNVTAIVNDVHARLAEGAAATD